MKTKTFFSKVEARLKNIDDLQKQIAELEGTFASQKDAADAAASAGDVESYKRYKSAASDTEAQLHVTRAVLARAKDENLKTEAADAWREFSETKQAEIAAATEAVQDTLHDLIKKLFAAVKIHQEAAKTGRQMQEATGAELSMRGLFLPGSFVQLKNYLSGAQLITPAEGDAVFHCTENYARAFGVK